MVIDGVISGKGCGEIQVYRAWPRIVILSFLLTLAPPGVALAHVTISPEEVQPGATQTFAVIVPTEKDIPTTGVSLQIPDGF